MVTNILILFGALFVLARGAMLSTRYAVRLAENFRLSKYVIGLIVVAVISILPETFISINASLSGMPEFGLATLFGSNVADLTLVFVIIMAVTGKNIKIEKKILKNNLVYPFIFFIPILMGLNGHYSRIEGLILILTGVIFYYFELRNGLNNAPDVPVQAGGKARNFMGLLSGMIMLLLGSHLAVDEAARLAGGLGVAPILIGMLIVGIGTTIPEMLFSLHAVKQHHNSLAVGDILGTVLADGTIVVGLLALLNPFYFPQNIVYVSGVFMLLAAFILSYFLRTGRVLTRKEGLLLFAFWIVFAITEYLING